MTENNIKIGEQFNPYRLFVGAFIPNALMKYTDLSQGAKLTWARLAQYAGEKGEAYPSLETLANDIGVKKLQAIQYLKELEKKQFIKVLRANGKDKFLHKTNRYIFLWNTILAGMQKHTSAGMQKHTSAGMQKHTSAGMQKHTQRESVVRESVVRESEKEIYKEKEKLHPPFPPRGELPLNEKAVEVLDYLNLKTGKSFSVKNKNNLQNIGARLLDGFTALQLKTVIDKKSAEWLNDEKMNQYLNPETLFRPKKFEIYLNSKVPGASAVGIKDENKYANIKTTHIDNVTGEMWVTGGLK